MGKRIYLDYSATTPLDPRVSLAMNEFQMKYWGNPSSIHREGQEARAQIDFARTSLAKFLNAKPQEIIFTSGATEANNLAIQGVILANEGRPRNEGDPRPHVITTKLEHQSVYNVIKELENRGVIEATFLNLTKDGMINLEELKNVIKKNTILVSTIFVSNEIGTVLPIREIGKIISDLSPITYNLKPLFHVDAVQATKFYNCNVEKLGCDLLTLSAHKVYGPKGIGALFVKTGSKLKNLTLGGSQEYGLRPGTQNTAGIIGMAKAFELLGSLENRQKTSEKISKLRDKLISELIKIKNIKLNGPMGDLRTPDNVSITIKNMDQDLLIAKLDLAGIAASTGSACVSGSTEPSHVIKALGKTSQKKSATLRLTLGFKTTPLEIEKVTSVLKNIPINAKK